jgi:hypothetical protein
MSGEYRPVAETEDKESFLHLEKLLVTLTIKEAESWKLMAMNWQRDWRVGRSCLRAE